MKKILGYVLYVVTVLLVFVFMWGYTLVNTTSFAVGFGFMICGLLVLANSLINW